MKTDQQIFLIPVIILIILLAALGSLYYYASGSTPASNQSAATTTTSMSTGTGANVYQTSPVSNQTANTVPISNQGVLAERLGWKTFTDTAYSYALSYPPEWQLLGGSTLASISDASASVSIQSFPLTPNTTPSLFAAENGVTSGSESTAVNAYDSFESIQGANTVYFIVNGAVGYEITIPNNTTAADAAVIRAMLLTFTTTAQR